MRAAFLTNPVDFDAPVNGGVQICSQEYYGFFTEYFDEIRRFDVFNSYHLVDRARRRLAAHGWNAVCIRVRLFRMHRMYPSPCGAGEQDHQ